MNRKISIALLVGSFILHFILFNLYFLLVDEAFLEKIMDSDLLYIPNIFKDMFQTGYGLKGWVLPGAPFFVPDWLIYIPLYVITGQNPGLTFLIYVALQYFLIILGFDLILTKILKKNQVLIIAATNLLFTLPLLSATIDGNLLFPFYLLTVNFHIGALVLSIWIFYILFSYLEETRNWKLILVFVLSFLGALSDRLFMILCPIPVTAALLIMLIKQKHLSYLRPIAVSLLGSILGLVLFSILKHNLFKVIGLKMDLSIAKTQECLQVLMPQLKDMVMTFNIRSIVFIILILTVLVLLTLTFRLLRQSQETDRKQMFWILLMTLFIGMVFWAPVFSGVYQYTTRIRYNYSAYLMAVVAILPAIDLLLRPTRKFWMVFCFLGTIALSIHLGSISSKLLAGGGSGYKKYTNYYPEYIHQIDSLSKEHELKRGLADYWQAGQIRILSREGLQIYNLDHTSSINIYLSNENAYYREAQSDSPAVFNYLLSKIPMSDSIINSFTDSVLFSFEDKVCLYIFEDSRVEKVKHGHPVLKRISDP